MKNKKIIFLVLIFLISLLFVLFDREKSDEVIDEVEETRAVYFSYIEFSKYLTDKSEIVQKENIIKVLNNLKSFGFNRIIVHVRPFSDSIYESKYYPVSQYVLNDKGKYPDYDVLSFFIKEAHKRNIKFDAWINPYRISNLKEVTKLPQGSIYFQYKDTDVVGITDNGIYFNPASSVAQKLIVNGIVEIVEKYNVDGIHFDDYFYPDKTIDLNSYNAYLDSGGNLSLSDYRLNNVKTLIKDVYSSIKKVKPKVLFGIAPEGNIDNCYEDNYLDVRYILSNSGYVDYIMPQIYFGFLNQSRPFKDTINEWSSMIKNSNIELIPALAFYKVGKIDKYASSGNREWILNNNIISREIEYSRDVEHYSGFSLFSYNYLFNDQYENNNIKAEKNNLKKILSNFK